MAVATGDASAWRPGVDASAWRIGDLTFKQPPQVSSSAADSVVAGSLMTMLRGTEPM